jgi:hypothetical protein
MAEPNTLDLLERIVSFRATVGGGLNDDELTRLLRQEALPSDDCFTFVSLCQGWATFDVPPQNPVNWYSENGWIAPEKEALARTIARGIGLLLHEPPDEDTTFTHPGSEVRHHLEMGHQLEAVLIAHPRYLKIHLFDVATNKPLSLPGNLLERLAALYLKHLAALYTT